MPYQADTDTHTNTLNTHLYLFLSLLARLFKQHGFSLPEQNPSLLSRDSTRFYFHTFAPPFHHLYLKRERGEKERELCHYSLWCKQIIYIYWWFVILHGNIMNHKLWSWSFLGHCFYYFMCQKDPTPTLIVIIAAEVVVGMVLLFNFEHTFFWVGLKECLFAWACEFPFLFLLQSLCPPLVLGLWVCSSCECVCEVKWKEHSSMTFNCFLLTSDQRFPMSFSLV